MSQKPIRDLVDRITDAWRRDGCLCASVVSEIERQWRVDYKGCRFVVSQRPRLDEKEKLAAVQALEAGDSVGQATRAAGISRATLYRLLRR